MLRVLDSMSFHKFIEERGPPFRSYDIFDDVYALIYDQLKREYDSCSTAVLEHIKEISGINKKERKWIAIVCDGVPYNYAQKIKKDFLIFVLWLKSAQKEDQGKIRNFFQMIVRQNSALGTEKVFPFVYNIYLS